MCDFEKKVYDGVFRCAADVQNKKIAVAVSGGADSISLLISLCNIFSPLGVVISAVTVNHNIRPKNESGGDVDFVVDFCEHLKSSGKLTECFTAEIPAGAVEKCAKMRKCGVEEAARFLRYKAFSGFCDEHKIDILCLAHNKNDNLETVLMRFLQGANAQSLCGIPQSRKLCGKTVICRPLLQIERFEIEKYLTDGGFSWRTDATNCDEKYFRNKVRLKLIPFLNAEFPAWKSAVLNAAEKNQDDSKIFDSLLEKVPFFVKKTKSENLSGYDNDIFSDFSGNFEKYENSEKNDDFCNFENFCLKNSAENPGKNAVSDNFFENECECNIVKIFLKDFLPLENGIKSRVIIKAMNLAGEQSRIPHSFIKDFINSVEAAASLAGGGSFCSCEKSDKKSDKMNFSKTFGNVQIFCKKDCIFFKKRSKNHTDLVFFDIIEKSGNFSFPFGNLFVCESEKNNVSVYINDCFCCENLSFPFVVRSAVYGDVVKTADGGEKKVSDIFSDWHIGEDDKKFIPVVQSLQDFQPIICVLGSFLGYKNWIVKKFFKKI